MSVINKLQVQFNFALHEGVEGFDVFAYNKGQIHLPTYDKKFGSHHLRIVRPDMYREGQKDGSKVA